MAREFEFGIRITGDSKVLASEAAKAEQALEGIATKAQAASKGVEVSAKQTAAAMRMLPAQMTDIAVGLSSGQSPFMVLMQQGGQLKDMFGGIGPAARAVGGYVAGLVNPFTLAAGAVLGLGAAYVTGQRESEALARSIILTNNAAATSVGQLQAMSATIAATSGATRGAVTEVLAELVGTGKVAAGTLASVAEAAVLLERNGVQSIDATVKQMAELGKAPVAASLRLNEQYQYLTVEIYRQIRALEDMGRTEEAAAVAQKSYAQAMAERSKEVQGTLGSLERAWIGVKDAAKTAWDAMLSVGRESGLEEHLRQAKADLDSGMYLGSEKDKRLEISVLEAAVAAERERTKARKEASQATQDQIVHEQAWADLQQRQSGLSKTYAKDLKTLFDEYSAGGIKVEEYRARVAKLIAAETEIGKVRKEASKSRDIEDFAVNQAKQYADLYKAAAKYAEGVNLQTTAGRKLTDGEKILAAAKQHLTEAQYKEIEAILQGAIAKDQDRQANEDLVKATEAYFGPLEKKLQQMEQEVEYYGLTDSQIEQIILQRLEEAKAIASANGALPEHLAYLEREIELRKRMAAAASSKEVLDANRKASEDLVRNMDRATQDINRSLFDAIMRGGKSGAEYVRDLFRALVLTPGVQAFTQPIANSAANVIYGGGSGGAGAAGGGLAGIGNAAAVYAGGGMLTNYAGQGLISLSNATGFQAVGDYGANLISGANAIPLGGIISAYQQGGLGGFAAGVGSTALAGGVSGMISGAGFMSGATGALGALGPVGWAALAIAAILGGMSKGGGPKTEGGWSYKVDEAGNVVDNGTGGMYGDGRANNRSYGANAAIADSLEGVVSGAQGFLGSLGSNANGLAFNLQFNSDPQGTAPDMVASSIRDKDGNLVYSHANNDLPRGSYKDELTNEVRRMMIGAVRAADVDPVFKALANSIDLATASAAQLDQKLADISNMDAVLDFGTKDPFQEFAAASEAGSLTTMEALARQKKAVLDAANAYDGSSASITRLSSLTQQRYQMELRLAQELAAATKATSDAFAASARTVQLSGLTNAEKYDFYDRESKRLKEELASATDPARIQELAGKLNESIMAAWGTLDESQQRAQKDKFLGLLDSANTLSNDRYTAVKDQVKEDNAQLKTDIRDAIDEAMDNAAANIGTAVSNAVPRVITVQMTGAPATSQVGGWQVQGD